MKLEKYSRVSLVCFVIFYAVFVITATLVSRGIFFDGANNFLNILDYPGPDFFVYFHDSMRHRDAFNVLNALFINPALWIGVTDKQLLAQLFSLPLFLFPGLVILWQYYVSKKHDKYNLFAINLIALTFFVIPNTLWAISEINLVMPIYLLYLTFFVSNKNYDKFDILTMAALSWFFFGSHENIIFLGPMLFVAAFLYARKYPGSANNKYRYFFGALNLAAAAVTVYFIMSSPEQGYRYNDFINAIDICYHFAWKCIYKITIIGLVLLAVVFASKPMLRVKYFIACVCWFFAIGTFIFINFESYTLPGVEIHFKMALYMICVVMFVCALVTDYLGIKPGKDKYNQIICLCCVVGILHLCWQVFQSHQFSLMVADLKATLKNSKTPFVYLDPYNTIRKEKKYRDYLNCYATTKTSVAVYPDYRVRAVMLPALNSPIHCAPPGLKIKDNWTLHNFRPLDMQDVRLYLANKYWDITDIYHATLNKKD